MRGGSAAALAVAVVVVGGGAAGLALGSGGAEARPDGVAAAAREGQVRDRTLAFFEARLRRDPEDFLAADRLVEGYRERFHARAEPADLARAEEVARAGLRYAGDRAAALGRLSLLLLDRHAFAEAVETAERALAVDGSDPTALGARFDAALATGDHATARSALEAMPAGSAGRVFREARWLAAHGSEPAAERLLRPACERLRRAGAVSREVVAWCITTLAEVVHRRRGAGAAEAELERALALVPGHRSAVEGLADLAHARADWRRAARLYRTLLSDAHPDLYLRLAEVERARGRRAEAERLEGEFLRVVGAPESERLHAHELALFLARHPDTRDRALAVARREFRRRPSVESAEVLAWVLLRREEPCEALEAARLAASPGGPGPTADYIRARALERLGRASEAGPLRAAALWDPTLLAPHAREDARSGGRLRRGSVEPVAASAPATSEARCCC